jgi:hypothetical protein
MSEDEERALLCSHCFADEGLKLLAETHGREDDGDCGHCGRRGGRKLSENGLLHLAQSFFVQGSVVRTEFGGAPRVQFNRQHETDVEFVEPLQSDAKLICEAAGIGLFHYGPRLWMLGHIEPLDALRAKESRSKVIERIVDEYPSYSLTPDQTLYRIRINPSVPSDAAEYDAPPDQFAQEGRLNPVGEPVLYASPDIQVCLHECRVSADDDLYMASISATRELNLLDLTAVLEEEGTEFESLDLAVHMLFLAKRHSYPLSHAIAKAAQKIGYDGVRYPSYFSLLRTGGIPFETTYGLAHRRIPELREAERSKIVDNVGLFGRPIADGRMSVKSINRFVLNQVQYGGFFGPAKLD